LGGVGVLTVHGPEPGQRRAQPGGGVGVVGGAGELQRRMQVLALAGEPADPGQLVEPAQVRRRALGKPEDVPGVRGCSSGPGPSRSSPNSRIVSSIR
jgi:hypothetical protein